MNRRNIIKTAWASLFGGIAASQASVSAVKSNQDHWNDFLAACPLATSSVIFLPHEGLSREWIASSLNEHCRLHGRGWEWLGGGKFVVLSAIKQP